MAAWDTSALPGTVTSARVGWYVRSPGPVHADTGVGHGKDSPRPQASSATVTATCAQTPRGGDCASPRAATHGTTSRRTMRSPHGRRPSLSGTTWARCRCARDGRRRPRRTAPRTSLTHRRPKTRQGGGGGLDRRARRQASDAPTTPRPATANAAIRKAFRYFAQTQTEDGHWACDYGGPLFLLPGASAPARAAPGPAVLLALLRRPPNAQRSSLRTLGGPPAVVGVQASCSAATSPGAWRTSWKRSALRSAATSLARSSRKAAGACTSPPRWQWPTAPRQRP